MLGARPGVTVRPADLRIGQVNAGATKGNRQRRRPAPGPTPAARQQVAAVSARIRAANDSPMLVAAEPGTTTRWSCGFTHMDAAYIEV